MKTNARESDMHPDLEWLARNVSEWKPSYDFLAKRIGSDGFLFETADNANYSQHNDYYGKRFVHAQWQAARQQLGLDQPEVTPDEEEAWQAKERQLIGKRNKYQREIKPGIWVDVYDVLQAWSVGNPALQHLIKKALQPGERGHKDKAQDMDDIVASSLRAKELESNNA